MKKKFKLFNHSLDAYVCFSLAALIVYTIAEHFSTVQHDTLTTCFFLAFGGENLFCAIMKIFKIQKGDYT